MKFLWVLSLLFCSNIFALEIKDITGQYRLVKAVDRIHYAEVNGVYPLKKIHIYSPSPNQDQLDVRIVGHADTSLHGTRLEHNKVFRVMKLGNYLDKHTCSVNIFKTKLTKKKFKSKKVDQDLILCIFPNQTTHYYKIRFNRKGQLIMTKKVGWSSNIFFGDYSRLVFERL